MSFFENFVIAFTLAKSLLFGFKESTKQEATKQEIVYFLFLVSLIPAVITSVLIYLGGSPTTLNNQFPFSAFLINFIYSLDFFMIPLLTATIIAHVIFNVVAGSALLHFFARLFKWFQRSYERTLNPVAYGFIPQVLFLWVAPLLTIFGIGFDNFVPIIFGVWGLIITLYALSNHQAVSKFHAFFTILAIGLLVGIISGGVAALSFTLLSSGFDILAEKEKDRAILERHTELINEINDKVLSVARSGSEETIIIEADNVLIDTLDESITIEQFSPISNIAADVGWVSLLGEECPTEDYSRISNSESVICINSESFEEYFTVQHKVWFGEVDDSLIDLEIESGFSLAFDNIELTFRRGPTEISEFDNFSYTKIFVTVQELEV